MKKLYRPDVFLKQLDERLYIFQQGSPDTDLSDLKEVRKLLNDVPMVSKRSKVEISAYNFIDEELVVVSDYLQAKSTFESTMNKNLTEVRNKLENSGSEGDVEEALDVIQAFENKLIDEEIRLQNNSKGDKKLLAEVKRGWRWLRDKNLTFLLSEEKRGQTNNAFLNRMGRRVLHGALRAASLRTLAMGALVPVAGLAAGATGIATAIYVKMGIGTFSGASAGHAFTKVWLEKNLNRKIGEISEPEDLEKKDYEQIIDLKTEYDVFIRQYHSDTAEEVRNGAEYQKIQNTYREVVKGFCKDAEGVEDLRMKQVLGEVKARNIVKKNKVKLFAGATVGGAISAFVAPKIFDMASGLVDGEIAKRDLIVSKKPSIPTGPVDVDHSGTVKDLPTPIDGHPVVSHGDSGQLTALDDADVREVPLSPKEGEFEVVLEEGENAPLSKHVDEVEDVSLSDGADGVEYVMSEDGEFLVNERGVYTVQDGNWLSKIWLDKNGGDKGRMIKVMQALKDLQSTDEGVEKLKEFGISSGDTDVLYPDDEINTEAIQEWFDGDGVDVPAEAQPVGVQSKTEQVTGVDAIKEQEMSTPLTENAVDTADADVKEVPLSASVENSDTDSTATENGQLEDLKVFEKTIHTVDGESTVADVLESQKLDTDAVPQHILERQVFEGHDVQLFTTKEGDFAGVIVDGERYFLPEQDEVPTAVETGYLDDIIDLQETIYTVSGESTVADVLESQKLDTDAVPQHILERQVFEGHDVQLFTTKEGDFAGVIVDGEYLKVNTEEVFEMEVGENIPFTDSLEGLVKRAEVLNVAMEDVRDHIIVTRADGTPILSANDLQQFRPDLFENDQQIASNIVKGDDSVLIEVDYPLQKKFLIETNQKGILNHDHVQREFDAIQKEFKKPEDIHSARQEIIKNSFQALTVEKPPADSDMFETLVDRLSAKIEDDADLTERMFSEKGWGDRRIRIAYSEDQESLEVQERLNINRGKRYIQAKWEWRSVLIEKVTNKK